MHVREEIAGIDGSLRLVGVQAAFEGADYPVTGSPVAEVIAYSLADNNNISGIAKKNGSVSLKETLTLHLMAGR